MPSLRLHFLGIPRFERDDRPLELTSAKAVALLAYLAVTRAPQSRERLLGLLWADSSEDAARKNLRNTLWTIRKSLADDVLHADGDRLAIPATVWVDVRELETIVDFGFAISDSPLQSAIALYAGPFLDGFTLTDAPEFEIWLTAERERLAQLYSRVLSALVEEHRAAGNWLDVIAVARRALAHDNLQEPMTRALMEAHARLGERSEALRQYDALRATLARELGVEPLPETEALRAAILSGDVQPITFPPRSAARIPKRQPIMGDMARAPFVGRRAECAALDAEFQTAAGGQARVVLLSGELGIGKSRLWQEWSASLTSDLIVLEGRCLEATQALPFAPLAELFGNRICEQRLFTPGSPVPSIWLAEVARLLPAIRISLPELPAPATLPPEEERRRVLEAFTQCLIALDARPLILFIDDLHWADRTTLDWLGYLVNRLRDQPLLLVATYRPEDAPAALAHLVAGWGREDALRRLPLARLTGEESAALVASLVSSPAWCAMG